MRQLPLQLPDEQHSVQWYTWLPRGTAAAAEHSLQAASHSPAPSDLVHRAAQVAPSAPRALQQAATPSGTRRTCSSSCSSSR